MYLLPERRLSKGLFVLSEVKGGILKFSSNCDRVHVVPYAWRCIRRTSGAGSRNQRMDVSCFETRPICGKTGGFFRWRAKLMASVLPNGHNQSDCYFHSRCTFARIPDYYFFAGSPDSCILAAVLLSCLHTVHASMLTGAVFRAGTVRLRIDISFPRVKTFVFRKSS